MAVYDSGTLRVEPGAAGPVLRYTLVSRIMLFCFLLPLLFLGFALLAITFGKVDKPEDEARSGKPAATAKPGEKAPVGKPGEVAPVGKPGEKAPVGKPGEKAPVGAAAKKPAKKEPELELNPIDKFLGAPAPEKPDKDKKKDAKGKADAKKDGKKDGKTADKEEEPEKKPSPIPAYVFAGIFAVLYLVGRFLEPWLVGRLFRRRLEGALPSDSRA
jgi:hypothetical protein